MKELRGVDFYMLLALLQRTTIYSAVASTMSFMGFSFKACQGIGAPWCLAASALEQICASDALSPASGDVSVGGRRLQASPCLFKRSPLAGVHGG